MIDLAVTGFASYTPSGRADDKPDLTLLERGLRRGLSDTTRLFMHVAHAALQHAGLGAQEVHLLFGSAFGEIVTAHGMLAQAYDENDASPARFRNSVHNTAPGLLSISAHNRLPAQAISAGYDTVAIGLLEAHLLLCEGAAHVLLVLAEEPMPSALSPDYGYGKLAAALVLTRPERAARSRARLHNLRRGDDGPAAALGPQSHPLAPALELVQAIGAGQRESLVVGHGAPSYVVDVEPGAR